MKTCVLLAGLVGAAAFLRPVTSMACGGCFHAPPPMMQNEVASVVTDHRMAFSISQKQTILWDQVRYQGNPTEFAWVLPVHAGARLELSHDAWLAALDAATRPIVKSPFVSCPPPPNSPGGYYGGGGGGCGGGGSESFGGSGIDASYDPGGYGSDGGSYMDGNGVMVLEQSVVGPYSVVTLRASNGDALGPWLRNNGFEVPANVDPIVKAYDAEGFDFIAMRLKPGANVQAMQPVRVITPGADLTLPLRMVTAGVGSSVGLALWVISEGRYEPDNFPAAQISDAAVKWFGYQARSNYAELAAQTMGQSGGNTWLVECSKVASTSNPYQPAVPNAYSSVCSGRGSQTIPVPCPTPDGGSTDGGDAGDPDASSDPDASDASSSDAMAADAASDAGCFETVSGCYDFDDWTVATDGMYLPDVRVTRIRSLLPTASLSIDLKLHAASDQSLLDSIHIASGYGDSFDPCPKYNVPPSSSSNDYGSSGGCHCETTRGKSSASSITLGAIVALVLSGILRRRATRGR